ncbi:PorP/SprF family type IX secretion system membrane protein [Saccharicrinis aurantiacus]|uniref:PorP/SprF family type IX secretion system membrane protein n=1 Tax=Saccharicrinis aurantiacus TaxID=1849719 RepID=UPI00249016B6|nr:type IX secretion system membrane protein PorP/SprF [Saccharicrinis aurantiacus]
MVRRILIFIIICAACTGVKAQFDPQFSQNMFNMLAVNPAYAGASESINLTALNRNQWRIDSAGIKTTVFSGDMPINVFGTPSGIGLNVMNDQIGLFTNLSIGVNYASQFELIYGTLSLGLSVGFINQKFEGSKISFPDGKPDDAIPEVDMDGSAFDASLGAYFKAKKYYAGISLSHLNSPQPNYDENFSFSFRPTLYLTGGYNFKIEDTLYEVLPSFFMKTDGASMQVDINTLVRYKSRYWAGLTYRLQDAIVLLGGIEMKNGVRFGYSYDITTSAFATAKSGGTHEFMVGYNFDLSLEKRTKRYKSVRYL